MLTGMWGRPIICAHARKFKACERQRLGGAAFFVVFSTAEHERRDAKNLKQVPEITIVFWVIKNRRYDAG